MLAGRMKLRNFLFLVALAGVAVVAGGVVLYGSDPEPEAVQEMEVAELSPKEALAKLVAQEQAGKAAGGATAEREAASHTAGVEGQAALLPVHRWLLGQATRNLGAAKEKDATRGQPFKVNLYQDSGAATVTRAKVDLDRDDKWDEKWTFATDGISRKVAPGDDEVYSESYAWDGSGWVRQ